MRISVLFRVTLMFTIYLDTVGDGVCGFYNGGPACDTVCRSNYPVTADDDCEGSPGKRSQGR